MKDDSWGDEWFPDHARIVINYNNKMPIFDFIVDPKFSHRWKEEPYFSRMNQVALARDRKGPYHSRHSRRRFRDCCAPAPCLVFLDP
jgi:hypothetical protein